MSAPTSHTLTVSRTARWWSLNPDPDVAHGGTLYVLHGYGQLAEYFIRKFEPQRAAGWRVVAPEGAHRFYLQGTEGRVGASWMTREARLDDIADYVQSLDALRDTLDPKRSRPQVLLGFSQGVATALRWAALGRHGASSWDGLLAHSGVIPPDLHAMKGELTHAPDLHLLAGSEDPYITDADARFKTAEDNWLEAGGSPEALHLHPFEGGHHLHPDTIGALLDAMVGGAG